MVRHGTKAKKGKTALTASAYRSIFPEVLSKSDQTKIKILKGAVKTYGSLSIDYVSYEDISRSANVSRPLIQHYFPDKLDLFLNAMRLVRAEFQELAITEFQKARDPESMFRLYVEASLMWIERAPEDTRAWLLLFYLAPNEKKLRTEHLKLTTMGQQRIEELLKGLNEKKSLPQKAKAIQRLITGAIIEALSERELSDLADIKRMLVADCFAIARAIYPHK